MKYIALLIVLGFMSWTWCLAQTEREYGINESREVETQIQEIITNFVKASRPAVTDVHFLQLFTEVMQPNKEMRVHVRYNVEESTQDDTSDQLFQGIVYLKSEDGKNWKMAGQDVRAPVVEFRNGQKVKRGEEPPQPEDLTTPEKTEPIPADHE
jgi:hypothetical protein